MNLSGQVVSQKLMPLSGGVNTLHFDLSHEARSMYFIKVLSADGIQTQKVIIR
jgi:hypothetical protein